MAEPRPVMSRGRRRWQVKIDVDPHPDGRRRMQTRTFDRRKDAEAWIAAVRDGNARGEKTSRERVTVSQVFAAYLRVAGRDAAPATVTNHAYLAGLVTARLGTRKAATVTRADIEELVDELRASGGRSGGLSGSTVKQALITARAAWNLAIDGGLVARNPVERVRVNRDTPRQRQWTAAQARAFLAHADTLGPAGAAGLYLLSCGPRRGEVLGLHWADVDFTPGPGPGWEHGSIRIRRNRTQVGGRVVEDELTAYDDGAEDRAATKTRRARTVPIPGFLAPVLLAARAEQEGAAALAGAEPPEHVVVTPGLAPWTPIPFYKRFRALQAQAGLPVITSNGMRGTASTLMAAAGLDVTAAAAWQGHTVAVALSVYTQAEGAGRAAAALDGIFRAV